MKSTGMVRKVDDLGRVVIPIELRRNLNIGIKDALEIFVQGDQIVLQKYESNCIFCGEGKEVRDYRDKRICTDCIHKLHDLVAEDVV